MARTHSHESLRDLLVDQLKDLYWAETASVQLWPRIAAAATDTKLREALDAHVGKTHRHVERLKSVFTELGLPPEGETSQAMHGLMLEAQDAITDYQDPSVRDAALITAVQRMEHYEMASYGTVRTFAEVLGYGNIADTLQKTLDEEGEADHKLTDIAVGSFFTKGINQQAAE
ncbi:MAG TPA: ferritin-like domain-containing protein [Thermomicrobiales bacterium]|nr:ferritin-like domain-containing protein [Thermomicrobiales bacterium]